MTMRLIIMRHAKSDWEAGAGSDHERPLNHRGKREAPVVAAELHASGFAPERVLSSDSTRTRETWRYMEDRFPDAHVTFHETLYLAGGDAVRAALVGVDAAVSTALVLGHNPGWEELVSALAGRRIELKTAHAAVFEARAEASWGDVLDAGDLKLLRVVKAADD